MYWECGPNEKAYLSTKFKKWFAKNPPPADTLNNIQKRLGKDRKSGGKSQTPKQSMMSSYLNGTKVNYGSYFRGKVSHVTAAMAVKLHRKNKKISKTKRKTIIYISFSNALQCLLCIPVEALPNLDKPDIPQTILKHAEQVLGGSNSKIWKQQISLPRDLRVKFSKSLEDDDRNVEGIEILFFL